MNILTCENNLTSMDFSFMHQTIWTFSLDSVVSQCHIAVFSMFDPTQTATSSRDMYMTTCRRRKPHFPNHTSLSLIECGGLRDSKIKLGAAMSSQKVCHEHGPSINLWELMTENVPWNKDFYKKQNQTKLSRPWLSSHRRIHDFEIYVGALGFWKHLDLLKVSAWKSFSCHSRV